MTRTVNSYEFWNRAGLRFVDQILTTSYAREDHYYCVFWCLFKSLGGDLSRMRRMNVPIAHLGSMDYVPHLMAHLYSSGNSPCSILEKVIRNVS